MNKFQKNIYQVWFQGESNIVNNTFKENIKNWQLLNKDWNYKCLDDNDLQNMCKTYSEACLNAYNSAEAMHTKIDLGKLVAIYLNGGIMVDMDMYILRSLNSSDEIKKIINSYEIDNKNVMGISTAKTNLIENMFLVQHNTFYNNALMICSPKHNILKKYIDILITNIQNNNNLKLSQFMYIHNTTGPFVFNKFIQKHLNENIISFNYKLFEPCDTMGTCDIDNKTIALHNFELSWCPDYLKSSLYIYYNYFYYILIAIIILIIWFYKKSFIKMLKRI